MPSAEMQVIRYPATFAWLGRNRRLSKDYEYKVQTSETLIGELSHTHYSFKGDRLILEDKAIVKASIGRSPDHTDALALTFAYPVIGRAGQALLSREELQLRRLRRAVEDDDPRLALLRGPYD